MDFFSTLFVMFSIYLAFKIGQFTVKQQVGTSSINDALDRAKIKVGVIDKIDNHYYIFEKDTNDFLCQAPTLEELPKMLYEYKKITVALLMYPEEEYDRLYWCINGRLKAVK